MCGWTNMNRDFLYLDGPSRRGAMWFRLWCNQPIAMTDCGIYNNANCRTPELENSADCSSQTYDNSVIPHQVVSTRWPPKTCGDILTSTKEIICISWIWVAKMTGVAVYLHSRVYLVSTLNVKYDLLNERRYYKLRHIWRKKKPMLSVIWCFVGMQKEF